MGERQVTYVWAVLVGVVGSCMSLFFEWMVEVIQWMLTGIWSDSRVGTFSLVEPEWRMFIPVAGGLVAGCILLFLIIQSSALIASTVGQRLHVSIPRLRLLVGCGRQPDSRRRSMPLFPAACS